MKTKVESERSEACILTIPEILAVYEAGIGLRWATPELARREQEKGTTGDMVVISNLQRLILDPLDYKETNPFHAIEEYNNRLDALKRGDKEMMERFKDLPIEFRDAIKGVVKMASNLKIFGILRREDTINSLLDGEYLHHAPSLLIIQRDDLQFGIGAYDEQNYPPFGKIGTGSYTSPKNILSCIEIDVEMISQIRAAFEKRLYDPISSRSEVDDPKITDLYDEFEDTLCEMLTDRILEGLRLQEVPITPTNPTPTPSASPTPHPSLGPHTS